MSDGNYCRFCGEPALVDQISSLQSELAAVRESNEILSAKWALVFDSYTVLDGVKNNVSPDAVCEVLDELARLAKQIPLPKESP